MKLMRGRAVEAKLSLTQSSSGDLPLFYADGLRVKQILLNLLSNAIKFTPPGGAVRISVERAKNGCLALWVSDTGIGIAPDLIQVALEPFRQISSPFARNVEGTGLGLALAKALMEVRGGQLELESGLNLGTTARLGFPPERVIESRAHAAV